MDHRERQLIHRQMDQLIEYTKYEDLMKQCLERRLLSGAMKAIIEDRYTDEVTQHKKLFEKITKRGPIAFKTLLDICQTHFPFAYSLLKTGNTLTPNVSLPHQEEYISTYTPNRLRSISTNLGASSSNTAIIQQRMRHMSLGSHSVSEEDDAKNNNTTTIEKNNGNKGDERKRLEVYTVPIRDRFKVEPTARRQGHWKLQAYPMRNRNRGVVFIVNIITYMNDTNPTRNGAETDRENLVCLFRQLGFTVFYYEDLTREDFDYLIKELKLSSHLSTECFAFYILAHGSHTKGRDKIYLHDNSVLFTEEILTHFNNKYCPKLIKKPKLFFFSICRGEKADYGIFRRAEHTEQDGLINPKDAPTNMPTYADMLICYSTVPGYAAHRDLKSGSWFVESMCKIWAQYAREMDVEQLMKLVGIEAGCYRTEQTNAMQTLGSEQRGFFNMLYLNPGCYDD